MVEEMPNPVAEDAPPSSVPPLPESEGGAGATTVSFEVDRGWPAEDSGSGDNRGPSWHQDRETVEGIREMVNAPARAVAGVGGRGWAVLRAGVESAAKARPQVNEEELLARHSDLDIYRPLWIIDPRADWWQLWCLVQGLIICVLMFWVPLDVCFVIIDVVNACQGLEAALSPAAVRLDAQELGDEGSSGGMAVECDAWEGPTDAERRFRNTMDLMLLLDFAFHFVLGFSKYDLQRRRPVWIWSELTIVKHYIASPIFVYDLVGCAPIDTMFRLLGTRKGYLAADMLSVLRIARLGYAFKLTKSVDALVARLALSFPPIRPISKLFMLIIWIAGITHVMACVLYFVGHPFWDDAALCEDNGICGWVTLQDWNSRSSGHVESSFTTKYVTALYYASTQITTVGFGDISATTTFERGCSVIAQMFGGFVFGYVLGNISTVLANENLAASSYRSCMETMHQFMVSEDFPAPLQNKVMSYMDARYPRQVLYEESRLWQELPPTLRGEIAVHRHGHVLEKNDIFHDLEYITLSLLCQRLDLVSFMQGDTVTSDGALADRIFIVKQGVVHIFTHDREAARLLSPRSQGVNNKSEKQAESEVLAAVAATGDTFSEIRDDLAESLADFTRRHDAKIRELCKENHMGMTYNDVLKQIEDLKSDSVPTNIDAILGGGISGGVRFGASAMDQYELPDVIDAVSQLRAEQQKLAADMSQGFQAISDRLDTLASR